MMRKYAGLLCCYDDRVEFAEEENICTGNSIPDQENFPLNSGGVVPNDAFIREQCKPFYFLDYLKLGVASLSKENLSSIDLPC